MNTGRTQFKKGERVSISTEFKKGQVPWNKGVIGHKGKPKTGIWKKCRTCPANLYVIPSRKKEKKYCSTNCRSKDKNYGISIAISKIGKPRPPEVLKKMALTQFKSGINLGYGFKKGHKPVFTGKKRPEISGENHPNWKGGITPIHEMIRKSIEYKLWREAVFKRDDFTCQECGEKGGELHAHHIKPFALFPELRLAIDNGITLCVKCHYQIPILRKEKIHEKQS